MNKRADVQTRSAARLEVRLTPDEHDTVKAIAAELSVSVSQLLRRLLARERDRLEALRARRAKATPVVP
jgi:hypothetical protein